MATPPVIYWRVFCTTDNRNEYVWSETTPTVCPVNNTHTIGDTKELERRGGTQEVTIQEEIVKKTGGRYGTRTFGLTANPGPQVTTIKPFSFPIPISGLSSSFTAAAEHRGDIIDVYIAPDTNIGQIQQHVAANQTSFVVTAEMLDLLFLGAHIQLSDNTNTDLLGRLTALDPDTNTVTTEFSTTHAFDALTTSVLMCIHMVQSFEIGPPATYPIGLDNTASSYVPANTPMRLVYTNNSSQSNKRVVWQINFLY